MKNQKKTKTPKSEKKRANPDRNPTRSKPPITEPEDARDPIVLDQFRKKTLDSRSGENELEPHFSEPVTQSRAGEPAKPMKKSMAV